MATGQLHREQPEHLILRLDCMRIEYVETSVQPVWMIDPDVTSYITETQQLPQAFV